jgi:hypothetical protein
LIRSPLRGEPPIEMSRLCPHVKHYRRIMRGPMGALALSARPPAHGCFNLTFTKPMETL